MIGFHTSAAMNSIEASMTPDPEAPADRDSGAPRRGRPAPGGAAAVWVMCRKLAGTDAVETVRAYQPGDEVAL